MSPVSSLNLKIIVSENGNLIEQGPHDALLSKGNSLVPERGAGFNLSAPCKWSRILDMWGRNSFSPSRLYRQSRLFFSWQCNISLAQGIRLVNIYLSWLNYHFGTDAITV